MKISKKYSAINKKLTKEVQELKENVIQNKKYFDYYEENKIIAQKHINALNKIINELNNENKKIKEELEESKLKERKLKDSKLNEYLEEKKIMEQKLQDNNNKISESKKSKNLLRRGLKKQEGINELKTKENNELKNEIKKLTKSNIEFSGLTTLFQDIEKKDNKARTFAPADIDKESFEKLIDNKEIPEDFDIDKKTEYLDINLSDVNNLFDTVKKNIEKKINIIDIGDNGDNKNINFNDIIDFSKDIIDGKINNFNKEEKYNEKFKDIEKI